MKKVLIVEDEYPIAMDIETRLKKLGYDVIGIASSFEESIKLVTSNEPDLLLMDINIEGDKNGIETAEILQKLCNAPVIFLTAYSEDKILDRALMIKPAGYLLKPFDDRQLKATIEVGFAKRENLITFQKELSKVKEMYNNATFSTSEKNQFIFIKDKYKISKIDLKEVIRLEAMDNYTQIFSSDGKIVVNLFLKDILEHLKNPDFIRVHKSHAINLQKVKYIESNTLYLEQGEIPIGRSYKTALMEKLELQ